MRKVMLPSLIFFVVAGYLLYTSITEVRFVETQQNGAYEWVDSNGDGKMDNTNPKEFVLSDTGTFEKLTFTHTLSEIDWSGRALFFFLLAVCCLIIRVSGYMIRLRVLTEKFLSWRESFDVVMLWEFASALTPSVVGGSGVAIFFLKREGLNLGKSTAIVMVTAMMDEFFYIFMVPVALLFIHSEGLFPENWTTQIFGSTLNAEGVFWFGYSLTFLILCVLIFAVLIRPRVFRFVLLRVFSLPLLRKWRYAIIQWGDDLMLSSKELRSQPLSYWIKGLAATFTSWTARFLLLNCLIMMVVDIEDHIFVYAKQLMMWMIMLISPTPGGTGLAEFAFSKFFGESIVPVALVGLLAILWRLLTYFPYLIGGVIVLPRWLKRTALKKAS